MTGSNSLLKGAIVATLAFLPVACAQQGSQPVSQGMTSSAQGNMPGMSGMSGMQGHDMSGHSMMGGGGDLQAMMAQCADMRRQMAQGTHPNTPGMAQMMAHCDEVNRMGAGSPAAPAATRSR